MIKCRPLDWNSKYMYSKS